MIELQQKLLGDQVRNQAFYEALKKVIKKGETTFADIGSGTGFLSFLAAKLGAKICYLYEYSDLLKLSKKIAAANGISNCRFSQKHSAQVKNPPAVDIVMSETLGNYALEEHIVENIEDAKRFLKPGGIIIPQKIEQYIAPVTQPRIINDIDIWNRAGFGLDFTAAREKALHNIYVSTFKPGDFSHRNFCKKIWDSIDFAIENESVRRRKVSWVCLKDTLIYGFGLWWKCELVPGVSISTSPYDAPTHWQQVFLPLLQPLQAKKGLTLEVSITSDCRYRTGVNVTWHGRLINTQGKIIDHVAMDMRHGL